MSRRNDLAEKAQKLRAQGLTYKAIEEKLGLPKGRGWQLCNRDQHRANTRESTRRYYTRGKVALCDMEG